MTHNQIIRNNGWCYVILIMQMMTVSIIIWKRYVVQNSYLMALRQVGILIRGGMLIKIIESVSHYYYSGGYAY